MEDDNAVITVPAVPIGVAVEALRAVDDGLDKLLESAWDTDEQQLAKVIEDGIRAAGNFIHKVADDLPDDDDGKEAYAKKYIEKVTRAVSPRHNGSIRPFIAEEEEVVVPVTETDVIEGLTFVRRLFKELGEELLSFSTDEVEEVAELALSVARIWLQIARGMTRRALGLLEKDYAREEEIHGTDGRWAPKVEEATESEIEEFYRSRGEEPPPRRRLATSPRAMTPPPVESSSSRRRRQRRQPARLLWHPLAPALKGLVTSLPARAKTQPFKTCGGAMVFLPFSGLVIFCLPGVLVTDHFLQRVYDAYGSSAEVVVDDGMQMARLGFVMVRLSARQGYRVARRQLVKIGADPQAAIGSLASTAIDAALHPIRTASTIIGVTQDTAQAAYGWVCWLKDGVQAARG